MGFGKLRGEKVGGDAVWLRGGDAVPLRRGDVPSSPRTTSAKKKNDTKKMK